MPVASALRRRILSWELSPGQRLKIDIAAWLEVRHMPALAALHKLDAEGALNVFPHPSAVVRGVDARFVRNLFDLRAAVEGMLTERGAARIDEAGVSRLRALAKTYETAARSQEFAAVLAADLQLHAAIRDTADNPEAVSVLSKCGRLVQALQNSLGFVPNCRRMIAAEHRQSVDAIARHDVASACDIARRDCMDARDNMLSLLPTGLRGTSFATHPTSVLPLTKSVPA